MILFCREGKKEKTKKSGLAGESTIRWRKQNKSKGGDKTTTNEAEQGKAKRKSLQ